eukprot:Lankesteria_metandrocarpae@DN4301_c0_g1_i1.p1
MERVVRGIPALDADSLGSDEDPFAGDDPAMFGGFAGRNASLAQAVRVHDTNGAEGIAVVSASLNRPLPTAPVIGTAHGNFVDTNTGTAADTDARGDTNVKATNVRSTDNIEHSYVGLGFGSDTSDVDCTDEFGDCDSHLSDATPDFGTNPDEFPEDETVAVENVISAAEMRSRALPKGDITDESKALSQQARIIRSVMGGSIVNNGSTNNTDNNNSNTNKSSGSIAVYESSGEDSASKVAGMLNRQSKDTKYSSTSNYAIPIQFMTNGASSSGSKELNPPRTRSKGRCRTRRSTIGAKDFSASVLEEHLIRSQGSVDASSPRVIAGVQATLQPLLNSSSNSDFKVLFQNAMHVGDAIQYADNNAPNTNNNEKQVLPVVGSSAVGVTQQTPKPATVPAASSDTANMGPLRTLSGKMGKPPLRLRSAIESCLPLQMNQQHPPPAAPPPTAAVDQGNTTEVDSAAVLDSLDLREVPGAVSVFSVPSGAISEESPTDSSLYMTPVVSPTTPSLCASPERSETNMSVTQAAVAAAVAASVNNARILETGSSTCISSSSDSHLDHLSSMSSSFISDSSDDIEVGDSINDTAVDALVLPQVVVTQTNGEDCEDFSLLPIAGAATVGQSRLLPVTKEQRRRSTVAAVVLSLAYTTPNCTPHLTTAGSLSLPASPDTRLSTCRRFSASPLPLVPEKTPAVTIKRNRILQEQHRLLLVPDQGLDASPLYGKFEKFSPSFVIGWQKRVFGLNERDGVLSYWTDEETLSSGAPAKGVIRIIEVSNIYAESGTILVMSVPGRDYKFRFAGPDNKDAWLDVLEVCVHNAQVRQRLQLAEEDVIEAVLEQTKTNLNNNCLSADELPSLEEYSSNSEDAASTAGSLSKNEVSSPCPELARKTSVESASGRFSSFVDDWVLRPWKTQRMKNTACVFTVQDSKLKKMFLEAKGLLGQLREIWKSHRLKDCSVIDMRTYVPDLDHEVCPTIDLIESLAAQKELSPRGSMRRADSYTYVAPRESAALDGIFGEDSIRKARRMQAILNMGSDDLMSRGVPSRFKLAVAKLQLLKGQQEAPEDEILDNVLCSALHFGRETDGLSSIATDPYFALLIASRPIANGKCLKYSSPNIECVTLTMAGGREIVMDKLYLFDCSLTDSPPSKVFGMTECWDIRSMKSNADFQWTVKEQQTGLHAQFRTFTRRDAAHWRMSQVMTKLSTYSETERSLFLRHMYHLPAKPGSGENGKANGIQPLGAVGDADRSEPTPEADATLKPTQSIQCHPRPSRRNVLDIDKPETSMRRQSKLLEIKISEIYAEKTCAARIGTTTETSS